MHISVVFYLEVLGTKKANYPSMQSYDELTLIWCIVLCCFSFWDFFPTDNNLIPAKSFWLTANQYTTQQLLLLLLEHKNLLKV